MHLVGDPAGDAGNRQPCAENPESHSDANRDVRMMDAHPHRSPPQEEEWPPNSDFDFLIAVRCRSL